MSNRQRETDPDLPDERGGLPKSESHPSGASGWAGG